MADTQWSPQQQVALDKMRRWIDDPGGSQVFFCAGYAGTGKSTIARALNDHIGGRALSAAYTGKAASVMRKKGLINATTIHRLIYTPVGSDAEAKFRELREELQGLEKQEVKLDKMQLQRMEALRRQMASIEESASQPRFILKEETALSGAPLLILDECSMVDESIGQDLLSFGTRVLVLGDPAQLPPVRGTGFFTDTQPDHLLTEIHRQATESPILRLATLAREGRSIPRGEWVTDHGTARVVPSITKEQALAADMILTGTNARRQAINRRHRELGGHTSPMPEAGERLMCLRNNHEMGLQNGTLWVTEQADDQWGEGQDTVYLRIRPEEGGADIGVGAEACLFRDDQQRVMWSSNEQLTWGSAATVHKAQGSEWDNVVGFLDWPGRQSVREWTYTLITRASNELTLVEMR